MKELKVKSFRFSEDLVKFVNEFNIPKENILIITRDTAGHFLFYYE